MHFLQSMENNAGAAFILQMLLDWAFALLRHNVYSVKRKHLFSPNKF